MEHVHEGVRVGPSRYGRGVFALQSFAVGQQVGVVEGEIIDDPDYGSDYAIDLGETSLEPAAPFRFLNHSCVPNCELVIYEEEDEDGLPAGLSVGLEVVREIAAGEQLTIDYAWPPDAAIPCLCGAAGCRGWIVCAENLDSVLALQQAS